MPSTNTAIRGLLRRVVWNSDDTLACLQAFCPACDFVHTFNVDLDGNGRWEGKPCWTFNGNYDAPTFSPSMFANRDGVDKHHPRCHSFLENGVWRYLKDCTHDMADTRVPVPPPDPDMEFERLHGWHLYPWCDPVTGKPRASKIQEPSE